MDLDRCVKFAIRSGKLFDFNALVLVDDVIYIYVTVTSGFFYNRELPGLSCNRILITMRL